MPNRKSEFPTQLMAIVKSLPLHDRDYLEKKPGLTLEQIMSVVCEAFLSQINSFMGNSFT